MKKKTPLQIKTELLALPKTDFILVFPEDVKMEQMRAFRDELNRLMSKHNKDQIVMLCNRKPLIINPMGD